MITLAMKNKIVPILIRQGVIKAAVFGSFARGDATKKSDIDILIKYKGKKSFFDLIRLQNMLENSVDRKVDLFTYNSIHPFLKKQILKEQKIFFEKK